MLPALEPFAQYAAFASEHQRYGIQHAAAQDNRRSRRDFDVIGKQQSGKTADQRDKTDKAISAPMLFAQSRAVIDGSIIRPTDISVPSA